MAASLGLLASGASGQQLHVDRVAIPDTSANVPAFHGMVPRGWSTKGGVVWTPQDSCNPYGFNVEWIAASPDEAFGIAIIPMVRWVSQPANDLRNCPVLPIRSARPVLELLVSKGSPGAQILDYRPRPDLLQESGLRPQQMPIAGVGMIALEVDAGEVLFAYRDAQGRDMRGSAALAMSVWTTRLEPAFGVSMPDTFGGTSLAGWITWAPNGQLDLRTSEALRKAITPDPNWARQIADHVRKIDGMNAQTSANIASINSRASSEILDMQHRGFQNRSAMTDRAQRESVEAIHGVETYNDPYNGGTVQLDNSFRHVWQLDDGSIVMTDDEFYQPGQDFGPGGQRLQVTQ
ncbi:MAG: hypothetical protein AAGG09_15665 [Pseudomonadota bacterium]